jgi:hypothetical protein
LGLHLLREKWVLIATIGLHHPDFPMPHAGYHSSG